jgi:N-acyl-D-aspartate/D-glutamate deacylase
MVLDPESGLQAVRDVGIRNGAIVAVTESRQAGERIIDATGLVVAPGFIDLHQHQFDEESLRLKALDGVTMALELEIGVPDLRPFLDHWRDRSPIHYGSAASHIAARVRAFDEPMPPSVYGPHSSIQDPPPGPVISGPANDGQLQALLDALRSELDSGALGIGLGLQYTPGANRWEIIELFRLAADYGQPVFVHIRSNGVAEPGSSMESVVEIIGAAAISGAAAHIVHVNSMCAAQSLQCLGLIAGARDRGLDITVEAYPWGAYSTLLNSAVFLPGWRERDGMDYGDLELSHSGERLTEQRFNELRNASEPVFVIGHQNPEDLVERIILDPSVMVASDGMDGHPRNAGSYARVLQRYVREHGSLSLLDAVGKMSLMPAQRLETFAPAARRKGRLQPGMDADIVVFNPETISANATYANPNLPSSGVRFLLVGGVPVVDDGKFISEAHPGRALTSGVDAM